MGVTLFMDNALFRNAEVWRVFSGIGNHELKRISELTFISYRFIYDVICEWSFVFFLFSFF